MINLFFTISTAEGGFVVLLEDLVIHKEHRGHGFGSMLLHYADRLRATEELSANHAADGSARTALTKFFPEAWILRIADASDASSACASRGTRRMRRFDAAALGLR
jgi:GNAT superfamily N-acetyltransferase